MLPCTLYNVKHCCLGQNLLWCEWPNRYGTVCYKNMCSVSNGFYKQNQKIKDTLCLMCMFLLELLLISFLWKRTIYHKIKLNSRRGRIGHYYDGNKLLCQIYPRSTNINKHFTWKIQQQILFGYIKNNI